MSEPDDNVGMAFAWVIIVACVGGFGFIFIIDFALSLLPLLLAIMVMMFFGMGVLGATLLGFFYITGGSIFSLRKVDFKELRNAITFLDMLCQGITKLGSVSKVDDSADRIDPTTVSVRSSTTALLLKIDSSFAKKWAKTVEKAEPLWRLIIEIPALTIIGFVQTGEFLLLIVIIAVAVVSFIATTTALTALALGAGIFAILLIIILIVRVYQAKQRKELDSLDMAEQSCKGLQMVFEVAKKQTAGKIRLYVLGDHEVLSYTGDILQTSDGRELKEAFLTIEG